ncbi:hypothetical protein CLV51_102648 [Chitinophaga niastensis]|uniref:Collagen triple helix repeat protein n=1 Tax=Chitinophaga niastensis TaxID=536980 RepID=A0A2P8HNH7_CHINA|nr:hypothetical protein [Chitinophaga niastensis]PSL47788.1 hypothetical protein CLV51_102648 [Chitinophaga niastensis]
MKHFLRLPYVLLLVIIVSFAACSKDGAQGIAGNPGPAGPAGPAGPKGDSGATNIIYSTWQDVVFDSLKDDSGHVILFLGKMDAPKLTKEILNNGLINVYFNFDSASIPYIVPVPYIGPRFYINFQAEEQLIHLESDLDLSPATYGAGGSKVFQFRYVLVPGGTAARSAGTNGVNWKDYKSVQKYLGLKD